MRAGTCLFGLLLTLAAWLSAPASAQQLILSSDQSFWLSNAPIFDGSSWYHSALGTQNLLMLPPGAELNAVHFDLDRRALYGTVANPTKLANGTVVSPRDILWFDGLSIELEVDGEALGLPAEAKIDALSMYQKEWVVSLEVPATIFGETIEDADLFRLAGGATLEILFSALDQNLPAGLDIDGAHVDGDDDLYLSFDQPGRLGGIDFDDDSVLVFSRASETWRLHYDASQVAGFPSFAGIDIDGVSITPEIFGDSFESGGLGSWSSIH